MTDKIAKPSLAPALLSGIVGAVLGGALVLAAAPKLAGERIVRTALTEHPELLMEGGDALRSQQFEKTLAPIRASLEKPYYSSWKGSARPKVVMTYFYDYACGYCRQSNPDIERLIKENSDLRVVYREWPILSQASEYAARLSLEASKAGRFAQFHDALYAAGQLTPENISAAAKAAGVAPTPTADPGIDAEIRGNYSMAQQLGATGTPLFVIGNQVHNAAIGYDGLKKAVEDARKAQS